MTYHSSFKYEFCDLASEDLIQELKKALLYNKDWNREDAAGQDCYTPAAYWVGSCTDILIYNLSIFLDRYLKENCASKKEFDEYFVGTPANAAEIALKVFDALGFKIIEHRKP